MGDRVIIKYKPIKMKEKIKEYTVVSVGDSEQLETAVNYLISEGWQPLGGASCSWEEAYERSTFTQTMVKYE